MLILKNKKAVVFKMRKPERITTVIPTAKTVAKADHTLVAVPHRPDETRVLRNLGYEVPEPMPIHYEWPKANGRYDPFEAQRTTASFLTMNSRAYCLNSMGTGKTNAALWAYDYMHKLKQVKKMLVICPLSTMERTWGDGIFSTFPHLEFAVLYGSRDRRLKLLNTDVDIYIINIDGVRTIEKELATRDDIDLIVVDELAMARNSSTERWKTLNVICNKQGSRRVWGMTGSPTPNSPVDAWAQCKLVTPDSTLVPKYFGRFRDSVMRQLTQFKWVPRPDANDTIHKMMQPAIRYSLDDCTDLPEQTFVTREVEMTKDQAKAYKDMFSKLSVELAGGQILAVNEAVKANKLIQIACIAYNTDVLTDAGWVPIQNVTASHKVWDGVAWVAQGGVVFRGVKPTITLDGVRMTPDHKVWVGEWVEAKDVLYANDDGRFDRPEVRLPNSYAEGGGVKIEMRDVGMPVRLRECGGACESVPENEAPYRSEKLRLLPREHNPRHDQHGAVQHLGKNETAVHEPQLQRLPSVRWARHNAVRAVAEIRKIFHRYGDWVQKQLDAGPHRQQRAVLAGELPVGYVKRAVKQQTVKQANTDAVGGNDRRTSGSRLWGKEVDAGSPIGPVWLERGEGAEPVYDLINCGPRSRFVVRGAAGQLLVVHNCGVAYDTTGNEVLIDNKPRIDAVKELIEESEGKVIVFVPLTGALEYVAKELATVYEDDDEVAIVHGETSKSARDEIFRSFQQSHSPRVLVANAQTMSHGLTLTAATTIIWYAPVHSNEIYEQACARVRRPGQTRTTVIAHVAGTDVERKIYKRLREKQSMQGVLLEMMKERNDD